MIDLSFALSSLSLSKFTRRSNGLPTKVKRAKQTLNDLKDLYDFSRRRPTKAKGFRIEFPVFGFNTFKEVPPQPHTLPFSFLSPPRKTLSELSFSCRFLCHSWRRCWSLLAWYVSVCKGHGDLKESTPLLLIGKAVSEVSFSCVYLCYSWRRCCGLLA